MICQPSCAGSTVKTGADPGSVREAARAASVEASSSVTEISGR
jgi:hypothetical protein